jgi:hypothetical protein
MDHMTLQLRNASGGILPLRFKMVNIQFVDQSLPKSCSLILTDSYASNLRVAISNCMSNCQSSKDDCASRPGKRQEDCPPR